MCRENTKEFMTGLICEHTRLLQSNQLIAQNSS